MPKERFFNHIEIEIYDDDPKAGVVTKSSLDKANADKIYAEYMWLRNPVELFPHPAVFKCDYNFNDNKCQYSMEYIDGVPLSDIVLNYARAHQFYVNIFELLKTRIEYNRTLEIDPKEAYRVLSGPNIYKDKTLERLSKTVYYDKLNKRYIYDDVLLPTLGEIIEDCDLRTDIKDLSYIHGDLCFSNIIIENYDSYNKNFVKYKVIDPRGIDSTGHISRLGDYRYEIGKLAHSAIGYYDLIKADRYEMFHNNNCVSNEYDNNKIVFSYAFGTSYAYTAFKEVFGDKDEWYKIMINLFLSMIPLHKDNPLHQRAMFWNALRLYRKKFMNVNNL